MMRLVSEQDVMAFHLLAWYFVRLEPQRSSQVVLIRLRNLCSTLLSRLYVQLHSETVSGYLGPWFGSLLHLCTFELLRCHSCILHYDGAMIHSVMKSKP